MKLSQISELQSYLMPSKIVDFDNPSYSGIMDLAEEIERISTDKNGYIRRVYEYVRDEIYHSADAKRDEITCCASEVLKARHGICFAKSHLLAALLRCKGIPTGFCYQKLILDDETMPILVYHG